MILRQALTALVGGVLALASPSLAAMQTELGGDVNARVSYINLSSNDPAANEVEDIQTSEGISARLGLDNASVHFDMKYRVIVGQLANESGLDYVEHDLEVNLALDRWLERYTRSGQLDVTLEVDASPSLPTLDEQAVASTYAPLGGGADQGNLQELLRTEQRQNDLLNLRQDQSGYAMRYGVAFADQVGPKSRYRVGWMVRDYRYKGGVIPSQASLNINMSYHREVGRNNIGVVMGHDRFVRGGSSDRKTITLAGVLRRTGAVGSVGGTLGGTYRTDNDSVEARFSINGDRLTGKLFTTGQYDTDVVMLEVGEAVLKRRHHVSFTVASTRKVPGAMRLIAGGSIADGVNRSEVGVNMTLLPGVKGPASAELSYTWANLWWDDPVTGNPLKSTSNMVGLNFIWRFL